MTTTTCAAEGRKFSLDILYHTNAKLGRKYRYLSQPITLLKDCFAAVIFNKFRTDPARNLTFLRVEQVLH